MTCQLCATATDGECYPCEMKRKGKRLPVMTRHQRDEHENESARPSWAGDDTLNIY